MAKRGLMDKVKQAVVKAGTPVARTLAKGAVAAVDTVDALSEKLPSNKKKAVTRATSVVKSAAESTMRATRSAGAAKSARPEPTEGAAPPPTEARRVTAKRAAGAAGSKAPAPRADREMGTAPPPSEATRLTPERAARSGSAAAASETRDAGRKTMPAAAAKRATKSAAKQPAKKQGFKAKRGQKHNHHR